MIGRRSVISIAVLCALVVSAFAAATANAEQKAFLCSTTPATKEFKDEHCLTKGTGAENVRAHEAVAEKEKIEITGTNAKTESSTTAASVAKLAGTISGIETEVQCTTVGGSGELTNAAASVTGNGTIEYTGCTVTKPAGRGCVVTGGAVTTKKLAATTVGQTAGNLKFSPFEGTQFAVIPIASCLENSPPANSYPVTGSLIGTVTGATTSTTVEGVKTQGTLKFGGQVAGLGGAITISKKSSFPVVLT
jgi:hypothetical protein